jgi:hypothetical protein
MPIISDEDALRDFIREKAFTENLEITDQPNLFSPSVVDQDGVNKVRERDLTSALFSLLLLFLPSLASPPPVPGRMQLCSWGDQL